MKKSILFVFALAVLCTLSAAQTPVDLAPLSGPFLYTNGPNTGGALAFGCVFTYQSGTTTPLGTYTDYTGSTQNPDPVVLNGGGYGSIWFQSGQIYSIKVVSSGGINCASGQTQYTINGVNQSLLNLSNTWQQPQFFQDAISILPADLQILFGSPSGTQTTLDIPPTTGNFILHGPPLTGDDTLLSQNGVQSVENKNLTTGTEINGCGMTNGPGTYLCIANNTTTATVLNSLAVLTGAPSTATVATTSAIAGVMGVVTAGAGITGNATIQQSGVANCTFDGATIAGDYVLASLTVGGNCHDSGSAPPLFPLLSTVTQIVGVVLSTNAGSGAYQVALSPQLVGASIGGIPTLTAGPGAGTSAVVTLLNGARDHAGEVQVTTGSSPTAGQVIVTGTFSRGFQNAGFCTFYPYNFNAAAAAVSSEITGGGSLASFSIGANGGTALSAATIYSWSYLCTGY